MANYNFTYSDGGLTYRDADGNMCAVCGTGGAFIVELINDDGAYVPTNASFNDIKNALLSGKQVLFHNETINDRYSIVNAINTYNGAGVVSTADGVYVNTNGLDSKTGWFID